MAAALKLFGLSLLVNLLSNQSPSLRSVPQRNPIVFPPSCSRIECPGYDVVQSGDGYEIRRYRTSVWMSTYPIQEICFVEATRTGFLQLFDYIQGKNEYSRKIEMTAPVITQVYPSDGPFCTSSFVVSFSVPKENRADPPPAKGLHVHRWNTTYVAVGQFSGFVQDSDVGEQAAALEASLSGTVWAKAIKKTHAGETALIYTVAQYNSPFEFSDRVNEIWMSFDIADADAAA